MKRSPVATFFLGASLLLLYLPIVILVVNSFNAARFGSHWAGFTCKWYLLLFEDEKLGCALKNSLVVAFFTMLFSTLLGSLSAFCLKMYRSKLQALHSFLIYTPLVIPEVHMGISLMLLFSACKVPLGLATVFLAHTTFCTSYVTLVMLGSLESFDFSMVEAAMDLGADWKIIVKRIFFPLLWPALLSSALLSITLSLDDFVITFFVTGPGATTLPLYIYSMTKFGSPPVINALSTLLLLLTALVSTQWKRFGRSKKREG